MLEHKTPITSGWGELISFTKTCSFCYYQEASSYVWLHGRQAGKGSMLNSFNGSCSGSGVTVTPALPFDLKEDANQVTQQVETGPDKESLD